ncbi:MAG: Rrf2 family transcriptional regulator [Patescibacteria group bacterium]
MKFSTRTTYGLRAIIKLAQSQKKGSVSLPTIASKENISLGYLERLFSNLKKAQIIKSVKGASGGYRLAREASKITVFEIIKALEGKMSPFHCLSEDGKIYCAKKCKCPATKVLVEVQTAINKTLKKIKLSDLI